MKTDIYAQPDKKRELRLTVSVLMGTLIFQAVLFYISPALSELGAMLICLVEDIDLSGDGALLVLDICDLAMYCAAFIIPALTFIAVRRGRVGDYVRFKARVPEKPLSAVLLSLGAITLAGYVSNIIISIFDVLGVGIYVSESAFPIGAPAIIVYFISSVIAPAFIEEFVYRGVVLNALLPYGRAFAVVASGVLFGVMHFNPSQILYATAAGCVLAYFVSKCGSIWVGVAIHMLNNAFSFLSFYIYDRFPYEIYYSYSVIFDAVIVVAAITAALVALVRAARAPDPRKTPPQSVREEFASFINPATLIYAAAAVYLTLRWFYLY